MDTVPVDFCESVTALWTCCDDATTCMCQPPLQSFKAAKWNVSPRKAVVLYLFHDDGKWRYGFTSPDYPYQLGQRAPPEFIDIKLEELILTLSDLRKHRDLKQIRVASLVVKKMENYSDPFLPNHCKFLDVGLEVLLKSTSCLMDRPALWIDSFEAVSAAPQGALVKKWIEERWFWQITIECFSENLSLLENQASGRKPTKFHVCGLKDEADKAIFRHYITSGRFPLLWSDNIVFPYQVMEEIVAHFQWYPEDFARGTLDILAYFDYETRLILEEMRLSRLCHIQRDSFHSRYIFEADQKRIYVICAFNSDMFRITNDEE